MSDCDGLFTKNNYCKKTECRTQYNASMTDQAIIENQGYCDITQSFEHEQIIKPDGTVDANYSWILTDILMLTVPILTFKLLGMAAPPLNNFIKRSLGKYSKGWQYFVENEGRPVAEWPPEAKSFMDSFNGLKGLDWNMWSSWESMADAWGEGGLEGGLDALGHAGSMLFMGLMDITLTVVRGIFQLGMSTAHLVLNKLPSYLIGTGKIAVTRAGKSIKNAMSEGSATGEESIETIAEASEAISKGLDTLSSVPLFTAVGIGEVSIETLIGGIMLLLQVTGMIFDQWDPCNLKSELDNSALHAIQDQMNTAFAQQLKGQFTVTTIDGTQIAIDAWPIPYFADAYAMSFISDQGLNNTPKTCTTDTDCGPVGPAGIQPICGVSGYCPVSWKDSAQRERHRYQNLYLKSLMTNSDANPIYHLPPNCITNALAASNLFENVAKGIGVSLGGNNTYVENWIAKWWPLIFFVIAVLLFVLIVLIK
jgi:hypothetical protein